MTAVIVKDLLKNHQNVEYPVACWPSLSVPDEGRTPSMKSNMWSGGLGSFGDFLTSTSSGDSSISLLSTHPPGKEEWSQQPTLRPRDGSTRPPPAWAWSALPHCRCGERCGAASGCAWDSSGVPDRGGRGGSWRVVKSVPGL